MKNLNLKKMLGIDDSNIPTIEREKCSSNDCVTIHVIVKFGDYATLFVEFGKN